MSTHDTGPERPREDADQRPPATGRHPVNVGHLVMGVAFVGLVVVWALLTSDTVQLENARWILPLPWLIGGAAGLAAILLRGRRPSGRMQGWQQNSPDSQA